MVDMIYCHILPWFCLDVVVYIAVQQNFFFKFEHVVYKVIIKRKMIKLRYRGEYGLGLQILI